VSSSCRVVLLAHSRYGKSGFQSFGVVLAVFELITDCMGESFGLGCLNALYAWLVRNTWLLQVKQ